MLKYLAINKCKVIIEYGFKNTYQTYLNFPTDSKASAWRETDFGLSEDSLRNFVFRGQKMNVSRPKKNALY